MQLNQSSLLRLTIVRPPALFVLRPSLESRINQKQFIYFGILLVHIGAGPIQTSKHPLHQQQVATPPQYLAPVLEEALILQFFVIAAAAVAPLLLQSPDCCSLQDDLALN